MVQKEVIEKLTMTATVKQEQGASNPSGPETKQMRLVICITGMPGAGKSTAAEASTKMGFEVFRMGDDVRMEAERRKLVPNDENLGAVMLSLRQSGGPVAIAHLCKQRIERDSKSGQEGTLCRNRGIHRTRRRSNNQLWFGR
jgi:hypothetical protein